MTYPRMGAGLAVALLATGTMAFAATRPAAQLTSVDPHALVPLATVQAWLKDRDSWGPDYTAGPGWQKLTAFVKAQLKADGITNVIQYDFPYTRWHTTEFPDKSGWSFVSDGKPVDVASYGTQTGSTGPGGVTAPMILYDLSQPASQRPPLSALRGKIVVIKQQPFATLGTTARVPLGVAAPATPSSYCGNPPTCAPLARVDESVGPTWRPKPKPGEQPFANNIGYTDYEYRSSPEDFASPMGVKAPLELEASYRNRDQNGQLQAVISNVLMPSGAVGAVDVMDLSPLAAAGARTHPTPLQSNVPTLMLDRKAGAQVIADALAGKTAKLTLNAEEEQNAKAYAIIAILPGKDYGTPRDQSLLLATHMDGPSIVEDDGSFGMISVLHYFSQVPQKQRPKTVIAFFDTRHFVPGTEAGYPFDAVEAHPEIFKTVVGGVAVEHWGEKQFVEVGDDYRASGKAATTYIWGWPNQLAIDAAVKAVKDQDVPRVVVAAPARPGVNGQPQQLWMGAGFSAYLVKLGGWPGWHVSGDWPSSAFQAYYPAYDSRVMPDLFVKQSALAVQLMNTLMTGDVIAMAPDWGFLRAAIQTADDGAFKTPDARKGLLDEFDLLFGQVRAGDYVKVQASLGTLGGDVDAKMNAPGAAPVKALVAKTVGWAAKGADWKKRGLL